jgi:hypothetical protein
MNPNRSATALNRNNWLVSQRASAPKANRLPDCSHLRA